MMRLTAERMRKGWSKSELARRAQLNSATVGWIEAGRFIPYQVQLEKLARALAFTGAPERLMEEVGGGELAAA